MTCKYCGPLTRRAATTREAAHRVTLGPVLVGGSQTPSGGGAVNLP
jgi:hypothetical protein